MKRKLTTIAAVLTLVALLAASAAPGALRRFCPGTEPRPLPAIISRAEAPPMSHDERHMPDEHVHGGSAHAAAATVVDPVCGMDVTPGEAEGGSAQHAGTTYWFCNPSCRERFVADPAKFLVPPAAARPAGGHADTRIYTCPMHPEIRQVGPGACPKCGMALEPVDPLPAGGSGPGYPAPQRHGRRLGRSNLDRRGGGGRPGRARGRRRRGAPRR